MKVIKVYLEDGGWMTDSVGDQATLELFGTTKLPTPFLEGTPVEKVVAVLQELNPEVTIEVVGAQ